LAQPVKPPIAQPVAPPYRLADEPAARRPAPARPQAPGTAERKQSLIDEYRRKRRMLTPPGWLSILLAPLNPRRVPITAIGITCEQLLLLIVTGLGFACLVLPGVLMLVLSFGRLHRRYLQIAGWAVHRETLFVESGIDFRSAGYAIYLYLITYAPLVGLTVAAPHLTQAAREPWVPGALLAGVIVASFWAGYGFLMGLALSGARAAFTFNPFTILVTLVKCLPHLVITAPFLVLGTLFWIGLLAAAAIAGAFQYDPALQEREKEIVAEARQALEDGSAADHLRAKMEELSARVKRQSEEQTERIREQAKDVDRQKVGAELRKVDYLDVAQRLGIGLLVVGCVMLPGQLAMAAWLHTLGLIVRRRQAALGWVDQRED
jgi:hypothetical protein